MPKERGRAYEAATIEPVIISPTATWTLGRGRTLKNQRYGTKDVQEIKKIKKTYPSTKYSPIIVIRIENLRKTVNIGKLKTKRTGILGPYRVQRTYLSFFVPPNPDTRFIMYKNGNGKIRNVQDMRSLEPDLEFT